ncbi:MFS transporter [Thermobifida halotolerans]|uniref:MFS transporter n=1 Tax=Thermobifida halotolerans TaxID=483545 RepID=A0AA97LV96_9ACTN|nr:MFS transporter [Thermobifida halotolerans]UOE18665.1 MFS transporter [Thermobifida halotolerans]
METTDTSRAAGPVRVRPRGAAAALAALCVTVTTSYGVLFYAFPVLALPITADTGWPLVATTAAFSLAQVVGALVGVPVGRWLDRYGPRTVMTLGAAVAAPALAGIALAPDLWSFAAAWLVAGATMAALFYPPAFAALTRWYGPDRVRALTALTLVAGLASTIFAPLTAALDGWLGWRGAYLVLAAVMLVVAVPLHALALRPPWTPAADAPPHDDAREPGTVRSVVLSPAFLALTGALTLGAFGVYAVPVNMVPLLDERGVAAGAAAWVLGVTGIGQVLGRLLYAPLDRHTGAATRLAAVLAVCALTTALLAAVPGPVSVLLAVSMLAGVGRGVFTLLHATAVSDRWGTARYGTLNGILHAPLSLVSAVAPAAGAFLAGLLGGYPALFALLAATAVAGVVLAPLSRPSRG